VKKVRRKRSSSSYTRQSVFVPRSLWSRLETMADETEKETSELVADALRLLLSGSLPAASASVSGTSVRDLAEASTAPAPPRVVQSSLEKLLDDVVDEDLASKRLRKRFLEVMTAVEEKDHFINRHSESVADLARRTAEHLGLDAGTVEAIETAAIVHDIGKSRIPESILGKRGRLTPDEWALVKRYPEFSAEILERFGKLGGVVPIVLHHQERWDGSGYPGAQAGDDIPIGAQIVGICDVYDVLTSDRAYRPALPSDIARRTIEGGIDRLWNPMVAEAFLNKVLSS